VRRLDSMSAVVDLISDPSAELAYRRVISRDAARDGWRGGYAAGFLAAVEQIKAAQQQAVASLQLEALRNTVLCRSCRTSGRRDDCTRCEVRTRETYGQPHRDDFKGGAQ